jgi:hypothetical protein
MVVPAGATRVSGSASLGPSVSHGRLTTETAQYGCGTGRDAPSTGPAIAMRAGKALGPPVRHPIHAGPAHREPGQVDAIGIAVELGDGLFQLRIEQICHLAVYPREADRGLREQDDDGIMRAVRTNARRPAHLCRAEPVATLSAAPVQ